MKKARRRNTTVVEETRHGRSATRSSSGGGVNRVLCLVIPWLALASCMHPPSQEPRRASICSGVSIQTEASVYETIGHIKYRIDIESGRWCVRSSMLDLDTEAKLLYLVPAEAAPAQVVRFSSPVLFERVPRDDALFRSQVSIDDGLVSSGETMKVTPGGKYRLVLQYNRGACAGRRLAMACQIVSEVVEVQEPSESIIER